MTRRHRSRLSLRLTFALLFAAIAALVAVGVGTLSYGLASALIWRETENDFARAVETVAERAVDEGDVTPEDLAEPDSDETDLGDMLAGSRTLIGQILGPAGRIADAGRPWPLPVSETDRWAARAAEPGLTAGGEVETNGERLRVTAVSLGGARGAVQVAQRLSEVDGLLADLRGSITWVGAAVSAAAGVCGWFVAGRVTRGLVRLTRVAEEVAHTGRLDLPVPSGGGDEVGRLGAAFDAMLGRLARSKDAQQRLVREASHELRTPLTSLRANIFLLHRFDDLPLSARGPLLADLTVESRELVHLSTNWWNSRRIPGSRRRWSRSNSPRPRQGWPTASVSAPVDGSPSWRTPAPSTVGRWPWNAACPTWWRTRRSSTRRRNRWRS
ncbi:HAMP domain-containing protein [Nocardiopsis sp. CNR-923]|uniref:HAMP domain-containing protein n=1 Tax=Nocardiopsis sp. CNR-923 TaxID=1904965 RepID=UPI000AC55A17|nr:HAMP domain-containing protein [Nocardiopsis sp. CNR-923]